MLRLRPSPCSAKLRSYLRLVALSEEKTHYLLYLGYGVRLLLLKEVVKREQTATWAVKLSRVIICQYISSTGQIIKSVCVSVND